MKKLVALVPLAAALAFAGSADAATLPNKLGCSTETETGSGVKMMSRPSYCFLDWDPANPEGMGLPLAAAIGLHDIKWSSWGVTARGTSRFRVKNNDPWTSVKLYAYKRATCDSPSAFRAYGRVRVTFPGGRTHTWEMPGCSE
jgi:hypothetical protein